MERKYQAIAQFADTCYYGPDLIKVMKNAKKITENKSLVKLINMWQLKCADYEQESLAFLERVGVEGDVSKYDEDAYSYSNAMNRAEQDGFESAICTLINDLVFGDSEG